MEIYRIERSCDFEDTGSTRTVFHYCVNRVIRTLQKVALPISFYGVLGWLCSMLHKLLLILAFASAFT